MAATSGASDNNNNGFSTMTFPQRALSLCMAVAVMAAALPAQAPATLRGSVTDPSGAGVPGATVTVTGPGGVVRVVETGGSGTYAINGLPPGMYTIRVEAPGFSLFESAEVDLVAARATTADAKLSLASEKQEITVADTAQVELDPAKNASATVLSGTDLDMLSDDPDDLQNDLQALAGPSVGPSGGQIFVDGFSNGQLPPKNSIREVRVNSNPFAAEFDHIGYGRVEILTKPGTDKLHGSILYQTDTAALDARNPYSASKPSFLTRQFQGNVGGAINRKSSFFLDFNDRHRDNQALIRANVLNLLDPTLGVMPFNQNVATPESRLSVSPRIDYQLGSAVTLQARYTWTRTNSENNGVGQFNLPTQGTTGKNTTQSAQLTGTWVISTTTINESRFQYTHLDTSALGVSDTPTIAVSGAFTGGAASIAAALTNQDSYEYQNYTSMTRNTHLIKIGARIRGALQDNVSDQNFNGTFNFASIAAYAATVSGLMKNLTVAQIVANGGGAFQYALTAGTPFIGVNQVDAAPFIQDDWRVKPSLTLSLGLRYEIQSNITDTADVAPRVGIAWGIGGGQGRMRTPKIVIRAGFGIFYDRFGMGQVLNARQLNGVTQQRYIISNPNFVCVRPEDLAPNCTAIPSLPQLGSQPVATYRIDPGLVAPRIIQSAVSIDRQLPKNTTLSINYTNSRGEHQLRTRNIGVVDPLYQYESSGLFKQNQLFVVVNGRFNANYSLFGFYSLNDAHSNTDGVNTFPANSYDLSTEWSRAQFNVRHRFLMGGNLTAPWGIRLNPMVTLASAAPFNIVVGQDLNGDTISTDRPSFATAASNPLYVIHTRFGDFNTRPVAGETIVPRNFGDGFGSFSINLRLSRTWGFGEVTTRAGNGAGPSGAGGFGGARPRGSGGRGFFRGAATNRRYNLMAGIEVRNLLNAVNPGIPVGTLGSLQFGQAQGITNGGFGYRDGGNITQSANRRLELQLRFSF